MSATVAHDTTVERLDVAAFTIPTDRPEADGTLELGRDDPRARGGCTPAAAAASAGPTGTPRSPS